MLKRTQVLFTVVVLLVTANLGLGERVYEYEVTVGNGPVYDHNTINAAIVDVEENRSSENALACIWVHPGEYEEQLHDPYKFTAPPPPKGDGQEHWFNVGCSSLPVNCDLRKPESELEEVKIIHSSPPTQYGIDYWWHISKYGVDCKGNNVLEGLTVENWFGSQHPGHYVQASVSFNGYGELRNCVISNGHAPGVQGLTEMIISSCTISTYFGSCIDALGTFTISDCELHPKAMSYLIENPTGIFASGTGTIEHVTITSTCTSSYKYAGAGLFGIILKLAQGKEVTISDVEINLQLTSKYNPEETAPLRVCGILSGSMWGDPSNQYPGHAIVQDCTINVTGIENDNGTPGDPSDDGADIMVDGVCVRGGGTVEVLDCSRIKTKRIPAGENAIGYEYLLNNENGTLIANRATVLFNPNGDNPPDDYDSSFIHGNITELWQWERQFCVKNASGEPVAWFDRCGNLILTGELRSGQQISTAPANSFIIEDSDGDIVGYIDTEGNNQGWLFIEGNWQKQCATCDPAINAFIIRNTSDKNVIYIDFGGNLCLTGELRENIQP